MFLRMGKVEKIKVLIIDDSIVFREIIAKGIQIDDSIQVVAKAVDPYDARDKILKYKPDVVTCDIEMPKMNGIDFVKRLMPQYPIPVIMVSSISERVFDAMDVGAVDFITKPNAQSPKGVQEFIINLILRIKGVKQAKIVSECENKTTITTKSALNSKISYHKLIAIGASTGGTEAIFSLLKQLPKDIPGIVIVQHIPPVFSKMFAERLNMQTHFKVKEAVNADVIEKNHIYLAPGDKHMRVINKNNKLQLKVYEGDKVNGHCPSVDILFTSVAKIVGEHAIGVILTGMGYDGAKGIAMMKRNGAITLGQDEKSCVVYGMPKVAYEIGGITKQISLEFMGSRIIKYLR